MSDPRRPQGYEQQQPGWSAPTEPLSDRNAPYPDPAYAGQFSYPSYTPPPGADATRELPPYWTQTQYQYDEQPTPPPPPEPPRSPRWLWLAAAAAVLLVVGLVIALVIANGAGKQDTVVSPLPSVPEPTARTTPPTTTTRTPSRIPTTRPTTTAPVFPTAPTEAPTTTSAATQTVVYSVTGEGRAMNITYVDTGGMMQMEFNVVLPWSKEVTLASASTTASVSVVTFGRDATCSVSVDGTQLYQKTGTGLTICSPLG